MFGERCVASPKKCFTSDDLLFYSETILKALEKQQWRERAVKANNYKWLRSENRLNSTLVEKIENVKPIIDKLTAESCASVAVKIDSYLEGADSPTPATFLNTFQSLVEEHHISQLMAENVKHVKDARGNSGLFKKNRVQPELMPPGRQPTVSFILESEHNFIVNK